VRVGDNHDARVRFASQINGTFVDLIPHTNEPTMRAKPR
jgi:hypothetical protein